MSEKDKKPDHPLILDDIPDCEWHTKDPLTGEVFFLQDGILYSKLPNQQKQKVLSINATQPINHSLKKKSLDTSNIICNSAKFSNIYKGNKVQIFGGHSIANCSANSDNVPSDNYAVITNILHIGIVELEFICPISCYNLSFGMISEKDLTNNRINGKKFINFKTSSRRRIKLQINYNTNECYFYLDNIKSNQISKFNENDKIPIVLIKKMTTCIILNPVVRYNLSSQKNFNFFNNEILFKLNEKVVFNKEYIEKSFKEKVNLIDIFGDVDEKGYVSNFICAKFSKDSYNKLMENFANLNQNSNLTLQNSKTIKLINKQLLKIFELDDYGLQNYLVKLNTQIDLTKLNTTDKEVDIDFVKKVLSYITSNFNQIKFVNNKSIDDINTFAKNFDLNSLKNFTENNSLNETSAKNEIIDYIHKSHCHCLLNIKNNKLKIIQRENNGLFDLTNFLDLNDNSSVIFEKDDLEYFLKNMDFQKYISYDPNMKKIRALNDFILSLKTAEKIGSSKILLKQKKSVDFYKNVLDYLNFIAFITKNSTNIENKINNLSKEKNSKEEKTVINKNKDVPTTESEAIKNLFDELPFGECEDNSDNHFDKDTQSINSYTSNLLSKDDYKNFIVVDPYIYTKIVNIINKIIIQISIKNPDCKIFVNNNMFNAYENLSSFINYPLTNKLNLTTLSDYGFYCENAFTNELKIFDYNHKLVDTDILNSQENIELYLKNNMNSYLNNSSLKNISNIIPSNYTINNLNYEKEDNDKIILYHVNEKVPILATCSKQGIVNIYSYVLGLKKLGSVNILKGIKNPENFSQVGDISWLSSAKEVYNLENILMQKKNYEGGEYFFDNKKSDSNTIAKTIFSKKGKDNNTSNKVHFAVNQEFVRNLESMGFPKAHCIHALTEKKNNFDDALDYLLTNPDEKLDKNKNNPFSNMNLFGTEKEKNAKNIECIGKWACPLCTYSNEGRDKCEMCDFVIPDDIYNKFLKAFNEKQEIQKKEDEKEKNAQEENKPKKNKNLMENDDEIYNNVLIKNIHICYNPTGEDPFTPFSLVAILYNFIDNKLIINNYKLMINPTCINSFIQFNNGKYVENITNRRDMDARKIMTILNKIHFNNVNILYPTFIGQNRNSPYVHLIPVENKFYETKIQSYYDSCVYKSFQVEDSHKPSPLALFVLCEEQDKNFKIMQFTLGDKYKMGDIRQKTLNITQKEFELYNKEKNYLEKNIQKINESEIITEVKIFQDEKSVFILAKGGYFSISKETHAITEEKLFENVFTNYKIGLLKRVTPVYNHIRRIKKFVIYDDNRQTIEIDLRNKLTDNNANDDIEEGEENIFNLNEVNTKLYTKEQIDHFTNSLNVEKLFINFPKNNCNVKNDNNLISIYGNISNKCYFDINPKNKTTTKTIRFKNNHFILFTDIDLVFNYKQLKSQTETLTSNSQKPQIKYNEIISTPLTKEEFYNNNSFIPLNIYDYTGAQSQYSINVSNIVTNAHRFVSNYPKAEFIFSHFNNEIMLVDNVVISSDINPKSIDVPFGEGLIFLLNSLENISIAKEKYSSFNYKDFENLVKNKKNNNEDFYDYDPVCYIKMDKSSEIMKSTVIKSKKCKYIYLLPVNGRDGNLNNFNTLCMSLLFFGVQGKVNTDSSEIYLENNKNYLSDKFGDYNKVNNLKVQIYGYKSVKPENKYLLGEKSTFELNDILLNNDINKEFYVSKNKIDNTNQKSNINCIDIVITKVNEDDNNMFDLISASVDFVSFKTFRDTTNNNNKLSDTNTPNENTQNKLIVNEFYKLILNKELFENFVLLFVPCLSDNSCDRNKKSAILNFYKTIFNKITAIKSKILTKIDYFKFITQNILCDKNKILSKISIDFIVEAYNSENEIQKLVKDSFYKILTEIKDFEFSNNGLRNLVKLLNIISTDNDNFKEKAINIIKQCLKNIEDNKYQTNELTYINTFLFLNIYPSDTILFTNNNLNLTSQNISSKHSNKFVNSLNYCASSQIHKEYIGLILSMKTTNIIEEILLYFENPNANKPAQGYNFRLQIFSSTEYDLELKSSKYYYDYTWNLLNGTTGKTKITVKNKDCENKFYTNDEEFKAEECIKLEPKQIKYIENQDSNILKINFKKWHNEFKARYISLEISINDGSKEPNQFPNLKIFPILIGKEAPTQYPTQKNIEKFFEHLTFKNSNNYNKIPGLVYTESHGEKKKCTIGYINPESIVNSNVNVQNNEDKKNVENDLNNLYEKINNNKKEIYENLNVLLSNKKDNNEKEKIKNSTIQLCKDIETLQNKVNTYNSSVKLSKNHSFNIQLIQNLLTIINEKNNLDLSQLVDMSLITKLTDLILFNNVANYKKNIFSNNAEVQNNELYNQIFTFIEKYFFKSENKENIQNLFEHLVNKYFNKENKYRNVRTIINNKIWNLFDITFFIPELQKCFSENSKKLWSNFSEIFYKISILIMIIMKKIVYPEQRKLISLKTMTENYLQFIEFLSKLHIKKNLTDLVLNRILSLYGDHLFLFNKYERVKDIEPEKTIDYLIELLFKNKETSIKEKIQNIIQLLLDAYRDEETENKNATFTKLLSTSDNINNNDSKNEKKENDDKNAPIPECYADKIILAIQNKILGFFKKIEEGKNILEDDNDKFDYILSLLNTCYSLKKSKKNEDETLLKKKNNEVIEVFIRLASSFNDKGKIGYSIVNNYWRYLMNLLEKGTLDMLFYNNNFYTLINNCYLKLGKDFQILLYTKLTNIFMNLYKKSDYKLDEEMFVQLLKVFILIINNILDDNKKEYETHLLDFANNLLEITIYGNYSSFHDEKDFKISNIASIINLNKINNYELIKELFTLTSKFLILKLNYSSYAMSECGNVLIFKRSILMKYILMIIDLFIKELYTQIKENNPDNKKDFTSTLKNYLIFLMFNQIKAKQVLPPVLGNISKIWNYVEKIIKSCTTNNSLIKIVLSEIMKIVQNLDSVLYDKIEDKKISQKKGISLVKKIFTTLNNLLNVLLIDDETTKYFAFELQGFKFFINRINKHNNMQKTEKKSEQAVTQNLNTINGENEMENENETESETNDTEINEELLKMVQTNETGLDISMLLEPKQKEFFNNFINLKKAYQLETNNNSNKNSNNNKENLKTELNIFSDIKFNFIPSLNNSSNNNNSKNLFDDQLKKLIKSEDNDTPLYTGELSSYKAEEFATARRLSIYDPLNNIFSTGNSINWSTKKKPTNGNILKRDMKDNHYYEQFVDFKSSYPIELKEVLITFSMNDLKLTEVIPDLFMECGMSYEKMDICVKLNRLKDEQYNERSVVAYGFNFFSNQPEKLSENDENYLQNYINQLINCRAQYFRFIVRRPIFLSNKVTHIADINNNKLFFGINCISLMGLKNVDNNKVQEYINDNIKNVSVKIISTIFSPEFIGTLQNIAKDDSTFENIKLIYNAFEPCINKYVSMVSKILINVSKYNYNLGQWLLDKLLNSEHDQIYAKLAVEIMKNNPEYIDKRINKYCAFIFKEIIKENDNKKLENIGYFIEYFCLTLNGLLLSPFINKIKINIDLDELRNVMFNIHKFKPLKKELINLITIILLPHDKIILNENEIDTSKFYHPNNSLKTLTDLYSNSYSYDYTELLSYLVSNNLQYEKVFIGNEVGKFFCDSVIDDIEHGIRGRNMLFLVEMLKNMSYNQEFVNYIRKNDYDFKLFDCIKTKKEKSDSILINNNSNFLQNIVIFLRNCISGDDNCYKKLAHILVDDLEICKKKFDKEYANKILMPLLSIEKVSYVCLHPIDNKLKNTFCSYINLETQEVIENNNENNNQNSEKKNENEKSELRLQDYNPFSVLKSSTSNVPKIDLSSMNKFNENKFSVTTENNNTSINNNLSKTEKKISIIPESNLNEETQLKFTKLFNEYEYVKGQKFPKMTFKRVLSTKNLDVDKIKVQITNNVINQGPFLIVLHSSKSIKYNPVTTFFFYNGNFPQINFSQNIDEIEENSHLPYTPQNMICQIDDSNYICASYKNESDYSISMGVEELGYLTMEDSTVLLNIMDIINLYITEPYSSNVTPYIETIIINNKKGLDDLMYVSGISEYEIFIGNLVDTKDMKKSDLLDNFGSNKIISFKYIDEVGNLNINYIKQNKYYCPSHPFCCTRDNPIFEFPSNIKIKEIKEMFYSQLIQFKNLKNNLELNNESSISEIEKYDNSNVIDIYYDIQSLKEFRKKIIDGEIRPNIDFDNKINFNIGEYEPDLPILHEFENIGGIKKIISVLKSSIKSWKNKNVVEFWLKWIDSVDKFSELPSFFSSLIRHKKCFNILFNLLCGKYDDENSLNDIGKDASKYIYEILDYSFVENKTAKLRQIAINNGIFKSILEKLESLTHEKSRKFDPNSELAEEKEKESSKELEKVKDKKNDNNTKKTKGVGYGSDKTGDNKSWDVKTYLEGKKSNSLQVAMIIKLLSNFFNTNKFEMNDKLMNIFLESPILPCLESAYRGGTLLELSKDEELYMTYLKMTVIISKNHELIPLLLDISKDYKPVQTKSVYTLLSLLHDSAKIFMNCLKQNSSKKEKSTEEKLAIEIINTYNIVTENIKLYQNNSNNNQNYTEILKLPVEKSYPLLLRELSFAYISMRNSNGTLVHNYSNINTGEPTPTKAIRLAQEFADLSRALPIESTNSIYARVDKDNMDYMKVLIMGSEGTPYSNGAFQFDVLFDTQYPDTPPKVTLMTTGGGSTRFNPNLYANGKVCLSLLGTWRGQSTENWDPKISTLLQVLISIQSIIMSDLVYYNEPACESEMGTPQGEAKNEAYSNIVRYCNIKYAMIEQIKKPSPGFEEVIKRHFYLKKEQILKEVRGWIERSKTTSAKYTSFSYDHNPSWAVKFNKSGEYTRMLEDIYKDLENTLKSLPLPMDLQKKTDDEKMIVEKKVEKMTFENIENVDMSYDENKKVQQQNMNINDDKVKDRWSRYIGAMGMEAVKRQANSTILIFGANGLGIEIAKNIVLSGCKELVLMDNKNTSYYDLCSQFYLSEKDIGKNRAEACVKKLQDLNYYVKVTALNENLPTEEKNMNVLKKYNVIVLTECDYTTAMLIDNYCRKNKILLILCEIYGAAGRLINDFGDEFIVNDKDGEDAKEIMVKNIVKKSDEIAEVTVLDGLRHDFTDDDLVEVVEVIGLDGINKKQFLVKVLTPNSFELKGDFKNIVNPYVRNGIIKQIKTQKKIKYTAFNEVFNSFTQEKHSKFIDPNMQMSDFTKINNGFLINLAFTGINKFLSEKNIFNNDKNNLSNPWDNRQTETIYKEISHILTDNKISIDDDQKILIYKILFTHMVQFSPLCAYFGGFAAQEVIKAITNKYSPANQIIYQDCLELIPDINIKDHETITESLKEIDYVPKFDRLDGLKVILGKNVIEKITNMQCLVVGAGAIGCELIKNFSMLNVGTGNNGSIYITDPDIIEVSNLTRQFLFREKHLRLPKSSTAAAAAVIMNPSLKNHIFAKVDKVCEETENIFTDEFFQNLTFVANALDNVNARRYVDSRCVSNRKPLLESGTLGPKGHVQVVIPFKTESYASQSDPEVSNDIPQCTLKMFPEEAIHCVEWARDQFGKKFTQLPKAINKRILEVKNGEESEDIKLTKKCIKWIKNYPKTFEDCLKIAREKFNKVFVINIKQLMYSYPLDKKDKNGKMFWTLPKRPPVALDYNFEDQLCIDFISAYACLMANMFNIKIPYDKPRDPKNKKDMVIKTKNIPVEEFKPNELKAKAIENEVESENKKSENNNEKNENIKNENEEILYNKELSALVKNYNNKPLTSVEFDKEDNYQIDIIYSMSALRCRNYKLEIMDWMTVKIKAGRIIPALATTTSSIAALQTIELVKIAKNCDIENYRNSFLNLAIPLLQSSEPGACTKNIIRDGLTTTLWDRWEVSLESDKCTIKNLFEILKTRYLLCPKDVFKGKKPVYSYAAYKDKKEINDELINKKLESLLGIGVGKESYVDLMVTFTKDEKSEEYIKNIPKVRVIFKK